MNTWQSMRYLDWPRFLRIFLFADVSALAIAAWALALRMTRTPDDSPALENLRQLSFDARQELQELLDDASEQADRNAQSTVGRQ